MGKRNVYTLERRGYFTKDLVDIFLEFNPTPDFDPAIPKYGNLPPIYLAKKDNIVGTDGRFMKEDGSVLEYEDIKSMGVGDTMKVRMKFQD